MRNRSEPRRVHSRVSLAAVVLVIVVVLAAVGGWMVAAISAFGALCLFVFGPFGAPTPAPVPARRLLRPSSPRSPPGD